MAKLIWFDLSLSVNSLVGERKRAEVWRPSWRASRLEAERTSQRERETTQTACKLFRDLNTDQIRSNRIVSYLTSRVKVQAEQRGSFAISETDETNWDQALCAQ